MCRYADVLVPADEVDRVALDALEDGAQGQHLAGFEGATGTLVIAIVPGQAGARTEGQQQCAKGQGVAPGAAVG